MKILITGASGFIGKKLTQKLSKTHDVQVLIRKKDPLLNVKTFIGDLLDEEILKQATKDVDLVYHLAAIMGRKGTSTEQINKVNIEGTKKLAKRAKRIIFVSSAGVYGYCNNADENTKFKPTTPYEKSKVQAEKIIQQHDDYVIIRPSLVYGEGNDFFKSWFKSVKKGKFILFGNAKMHLVHVDEVVQSLILAQKLKNESLVVAGEKPLTIEKICKLITNKKIIKIPKQIIYPIAALITKLKINFPLNLSTYNLFSKTRTYNIEKLKSLGFEPKNVEHSLKKFISWTLEDS